MATRQEALALLLLRCPANPAPEDIFAWVLDELAAHGMATFEFAEPLREPERLGTVVIAGHQHTADGPPSRWVKFTQHTSSHSTSRWINERGQTTTWAMLTNPRIEEQG